MALDPLVQHADTALSENRKTLLGKVTCARGRNKKWVMQHYHFFKLTGTSTSHEHKTHVKGPTIRYVIPRKMKKDRSCLSYALTKAQ